MTSRVFAGFALFASLSVLSASAAAQETKPAEPAPPPAPAPAPAAPAPAPAPELPALPPVPPPFSASGGVALNPVSEEPATSEAPQRRLVFDAALGYTGGGSVKHPELSGNGFSGEMLELGVGAEINPKWRLVLSFASFQTNLERIGGTNQFRAVSGALRGGAGYQPLVSCPDCIGTGGQGGLVAKQPLHINTLGPRLDYLPFGSDSLYVGVTAGAAMMQDLSFRGGFAVAARAGFEWQPYSALGISLEAGAHGQVYSDSSAALPYAAIMLRLLAAPPPIGTTETIKSDSGTTRPPMPAQPPAPYR